MLISYKNVTVSHDSGEVVLNGVDFHADEGEFIYIIGKVGSGKSSLLRTVYGDLEIDDATEAVVLERDMMKIRRKEVQLLRREMGIIFQDFKLLTDRSVRRNLEFVLKATGWKGREEIENRVKEVLRLVKMEGVEDKMPHELSGGEQQRIAIARSLLNSPKVILADEPTGNLDPETAEDIMGLFRDISASGTAVVVTTHNIPMLSKFHGVVYQCECGKLTEVTQKYE
ncbi:MAG: ATP-binding cassette domain-containing protein [Prevotellaceae bacterium]|nr:ATP-binding cassette domain-containing protein [Prevotellaceae bacterium]MDO4932175.1 ATP-binding cassette domain-containing protein [Prevotellaceae bacterium]